jgi:thiamine pyrophosphate-dependent acetolactate synthase large subunit-like protein
MASDASDTTGIDRRSFLKGAAAAGAAAALAGKLAETAHAQEASEKPAPASKPAAGGQRALLSSIVVSRPGSDFMVDVMKSLGIDYVASNPGSSFRSLQESIVNYGGNSKPEFITAMHEESSAAIAHGYAKAAGKPMAILAHSTVGLQHAAMGIYNAWCDRVPILLMAGNLVDAAKRRPGVEWYHSAQDPAALVRDFTKWDDQPASLQHFAESMARAYKVATTPPTEPVLIVADADLQETQVENEAELKIPKLSTSAPPQGDVGALREAARMLGASQNPVIIADRAARTADGLKLMVQLAETAGAPVIDLGGRMNMPNDHFANLSVMRGQLIRDADFILALEVADLWGLLNSVGDPYHDYRRIAKPDVKVVHISLGDTYIKSNYQDFERFQPVDLSIQGDVQASLPTLIDAIKSEVGTKASGRLDSLKELFQRQQQNAVTNASYGWDASPISTARMAAETWNVIKNEKWSLATNGLQGWPARLWKITDYNQVFGGSGGAGVGYNSPAAVGVALANKAKGLITINFQPDGDLMYAPGVLWTAAHHKVPLLSIVHNNRAYHQEVMHLQKMASLHNRRADQAGIGTTITNPDIDYAKLAASMGWWSAGPITDPSQLASTLKQALDVVKSGSPALVDVVSQPR